ncbi:MAG TPA: hypothetical protein VF937_01915 [Chloroflexota bacterium]
MKRFFPLMGASLALALSMIVPAAAQASGWIPGPGAILDNTYDGFIDQPTSGATIPASGSFLVSGWFVDKTAQGWAGADNVQVFLGTMDGGGKMIASALFAQSRPDVAAAEGNPYWTPSGFVASIPGSAVPAGAQTLSVYVHTGGKGWWYKQVAVTGGGSGAGVSAPTAGGPPQITIGNPTEGQNVSAAGSSSYTITGTAIDPSGGPGTIDSVDVWIFGERNASGATELGTATVQSDGSWSLSFVPTKFPSTHTNIYVYARSKVTGLETEQVRGFNIIG